MDQLKRMARMEPEPSAAPTETRWLLGGSVGRLKKLAGMDSSADREQLPTATEKKSLLGNAGKGLGALKEVTAKAGQAAGKATKDLGSRVGQSVGLVETPEPTLLDEVNDLTKLSRKHRLYGFLVCWLLGMLLTALSVLGIPALLLGNPESFALPYSMGSIVSMSGTLFIVGPWKQCQTMWSGKRAMATAMYVGCVAGTLTSAIKGFSILCLVFMVMQFFAMIWYTASYIPFARALLAKIGPFCLKRCPWATCCKTSCGCCKSCCTTCLNCLC